MSCSWEVGGGGVSGLWVDPDGVSDSEAGELLRTSFDKMIDAPERSGADLHFLLDDGRVLTFWAAGDFGPHDWRMIDP